MALTRWINSRSIFSHGDEDMILYKHIYAFKHTYTHAFCIHMRPCTFIHILTCKCIHDLCIQTHTYIHTYIHVHMSIHPYMSIYIHINSNSESGSDATVPLIIIIKTWLPITYLVLDVQVRTFLCQSYSDVLQTYLRGLH